MIIQLKQDVSPNNLELITKNIIDLKYKPNAVKTQSGYYLVCIGKNEIDIRQIGNLQGIADVHRVLTNINLFRVNGNLITQPLI